MSCSLISPHELPVLPAACRTLKILKVALVKSIDLNARFRSASSREAAFTRSVYEACSIGSDSRVADSPQDHPL